MTYLGLDGSDSHAIVAQLLTASSVHDGDAVKPLLEQVEQEVKAFYGDGAYDQWKVRDHLQSEKIDQVIPPRKNAVIQRHGNSNEEPLERDVDLGHRRQGVHKGQPADRDQLQGQKA